MDLIQRFSFRSQVLASFALLLAVLGVSSWVGLGKVELLGGKVETLTSNVFVRYELLSSMVGEATSVSRLSRQVITASDPATRDEAQARYDAAWASYQDAAGALDAIPASEDVLRMRRAAASAASAVKSIHRRAFASADGDPAQGLLALELASRSAMAEWISAIERNRVGVQARVHDVGKAAVAEAAAARQKNLAGALAGVVVALLCGGWLLLVVRRLIGGDLRIAKAGVEAVGEGVLDKPLPVRPADLDSIMARIESMRFSLLARAEADARRAESDARLLAALERAPSGVMIADVQNTIVYANATVIDMLVANEAAIRERAPKVDVRNLVGVSMDAFHQNPESQRGIVAQLTGEQRTRISLGQSHFALTVSPAMDAQGQRVGTVLGWTDLTAEIAIENEIARITTAAAEGQLEVRIPEERFVGPQRMLARSMNGLLDAVGRSIGEVQRVMEALARGDLTVRSEADLGGAFGELRDAANSTADELNGVLQGIRQSASKVLGAAGEIAQGNDDLSRRTESQAANLEETAASMEELTSTVRNNAESARQAAQLAQSATAQAQGGFAAVGRVVESIGGMAAASARVKDITGTIDGIAFQTNILALNAAVEAARAGESGRGFAVVAAEIRALAQRCSVAAKEIRSLIEQSAERVAGGAREAGEAGQIIEQLQSAVRRVNDLMAEISASSAEQAMGIEQVNQTVMQLDEGTQQNAALVEEASAAAASLRQQAVDLDVAVGRFVLVESRQAPRSILRPSHAVPSVDADPHALVQSLVTRQPRRVAEGRPAATPRQAEADAWQEF